MKNSKRTLKNLILLLFLFLFLVFDARAVSFQSESSERETFTLNQLSKIDTAVLEGKNPSYTIYIPIPQNWDVDSLNLNLIVQFSPILLPTSTLTLMAENTPIDTIKLDNTKEQPILWNITVPKSAISKKMTTLRLVGYMKISEDVCQDIENQGNWITVSGNSRINYNFHRQSISPNLIKFPYPFIQKDAPYTDKISFVMPPKLTLANFSPYLKLAYSLSKQASWRGVTFDIRSADDFKNKTLDTNAIISATPDDFDFSQFGISFPLLLKDNQWLLNGRLLPDNQGFVFLTKNPQQPAQSLLIISANHTQGISTVIEAINSNVVKFMSEEHAFYIASPLSQVQTKEGKKTRFTLSELGYKDNVVFGNGQQTITYQLEVSGGLIAESAKLSLIYSHSPFLDLDTASYMMVKLNGFPLNGAKLQPDTAAKSYFELELPKKFLTAGKNNLDVIFDLRLPEKYCSRNYLSQAWGIVYDASYFNFNKNEPANKYQLNYFPYLFEKDVVIGLPVQDFFYNNQPFLLELIQLAASLKESASLSIISNEELEGKTGRNLIYIGTGQGKSFLIENLRTLFNDMVNNLNLTDNQALKLIDKTLFVHAFDKEQGVGFLAMTQSLAKGGDPALVVYGYTANDLMLALSLLNNPYRLKTLSGNLAVSFQNGTYTNLSSKVIKEQVQTELKLEHANQLTLQVILYIVLGAIVLLLLFYSIRLMRKT